MIHYKELAIALARTAGVIGCIAAVVATFAFFPMVAVIAAFSFIPGLVLWSIFIAFYRVELEKSGKVKTDPNDIGDAW